MTRLGRPRKNAEVEVKSAPVDLIRDEGLNPGDRNKKPGVVLKAYVNRKELPRSVRDDKGNPKGKGEPRFLVNNTSKGQELIAVYRKHNGVGRSLVKMLKPKKDKALINQLRAAGVPGA